MNRTIKNRLKIWCLLISAVILLGAGTFVLKKEFIIHHVQISHPGKQGADLPELTLVEVKSGESLSSQFYMDVVSVYCFDSICKVDTVRLYWNDIGNYVRYKLPPTIYLEKAKGKEFTDDEYERLQQILLNKDSPFADLAIDKIVKTNDVAHGLELDAYSGATVLEFNKNESVKGAALTCYTLWHWANGAVGDSIRKITAASLGLEQFHLLLSGEKDAYKVFALEQLIEKKAYDKLSQDAILSSQINDVNNLSKLQLTYLEKGSNKLYFEGVKTLLQTGKKEQRIKVLQSLHNSNKIAELAYLEGLSDYLSELESYSEIDLFLSIIESQNASSVKLLENTFSLLNQNILIARRAYWFLSYQKLSAKQQKVLDVFYKKNEEYL